MNVLSLFDGMSCGKIALDRAGIKINNYFASEIKKSAIRCAQFNNPFNIQVGDINKLTYQDGCLATENGVFKRKIDLLIGGSPCQDFSILKTNRKNLEGDKSKLFYEFLRVLREVKPKYFLLENVRMNKESEEQLNEYLGVDGIHINSKLVSYQNRPRIYWTNIPGASAPRDKKISFQRFIERDTERVRYCKVKRTPSRERMWNNGETGNNIGSRCPNITKADKIGCLTRKQDRSPNSGLIEYEDFCRYLSRRELEMAQTVPKGYTDCVSYNQAQDLLGDGWTVDVIAHLFKGLKSV